MARAAEHAQKVEVKSRADLRTWLAANHGGSDAVWLVTYKKHTAHYLDYPTLIEELLCWGWIDSVTRKVDDDRTSVLIAPRDPKSAWSAVNKAHVEVARASGAMTPAGEAAIAAAQANGMWSFLDDVERLECPNDLSDALANARVRNVWEDYPRSVKRGTLEWIKTARTAPTRAKRSTDVAESAAQGMRPSPFRR